MTGFSLAKENTPGSLLGSPSGTLKGVGPGTELDWYVQRLRANQSNVVKVDLCKQMLGPEGAREIMEALENSTTARSVLLGADEIGPEGARAVGQALLKNRSLKTVFLGCNGIGEEGAKYIAEAIENNDVVEGYWLKRNQIGLTGLQAILSALRTNQSVKTLDLVQNNLGVEGARLLEEAFVDAAHPLSIISLYLSGNEFGVDGARHIAGIIRRNTTIKHLYLGLNNLGEEGGLLIAEALKENKTLLTLAVLSNELGPRAAATFADALRLNNTLTCLDLGYAKATKALEGKPNVIEDAGAQAIAAAVAENTSLRVLNLTQNGIGEAGYLAVAEALRTNTSLTHLVLDRNRMPTAPVYQAFTDVLTTTNTTLSKLTLANASQRHPNASLAAQLKALVARNKARAAKLDPSALPEDEQKRLRELRDIKSDYRLPKATTAGDAQDKRKQQDADKAVQVEGQGEAKKPKLDDKATLNRLRKLKKRLRSLEASNASEELKLALQQQIAALTPSAEESAEAAVHRRLAQIDKLETMLRDGVQLTAAEHNKIARKQEFLQRLQAFHH